MTHSYMELIDVLLAAAAAMHFLTDVHIPVLIYPTTLAVTWWSRGGVHFLHAVPKVCPHFGTSDVAVI